MPGASGDGGTDPALDPRVRYPQDGHKNDIEGMKKVEFSGILRYDDEKLQVRKDGRQHII